MRLKRSKGGDFMLINLLPTESFDQTQKGREKEEWLTDLRACMRAAWIDGHWGVILRGLEIEARVYGWLGNKASQKPTDN